MTLPWMGETELMGNMCRIAGNVAQVDSSFRRSQNAIQIKNRWAWAHVFLRAFLPRAALLVSEQSSPGRDCPSGRSCAQGVALVTSSGQQGQMLALPGAVWVSVTPEAASLSFSLCAKRGSAGNAAPDPNAVEFYLGLGVCPHHPGLPSSSSLRQ